MDDFERNLKIAFIGNAVAALALCAVVDGALTGCFDKKPGHDRLQDFSVNALALVQKWAPNPICNRPGSFGLTKPQPAF